MKEYLLFDLDGTLTDPKEGITTCVQYALKSFEIDEPDLDKLEPFIGPPLKDSFKTYYNMTDEQAEEAVTKYRERFQDTGIFENELYGGIHDLLRSLKSKGMHLAVASSKPTVFVERILKHFKIDKYFEVVVGSELDGTRVNKAEVMLEALHRFFGDKPVQFDKVYMIGDRKYDIDGARTLRIESVGVAYGYGSMEELKEAKADYIVKSVAELKKFLLRGTEDEIGRAGTAGSAGAAGPGGAPGQKKPRNSWAFIWQMLFPFLLFLVIRSLAAQAFQMLFAVVADRFPGPVADFLIYRDEAEETLYITANAATISAALGYIAGAVAIFKNAKHIITRTAENEKLNHLKKEPGKNYALLFGAAAGATIGINLLLELIQLTQNSAAYQEVVKSQYASTFLIGFISYVIITPVAEELLFRGVVYNCVRRIVKVNVAVLISGFFFAAYHGNSVQGLYAFVMGCLMAYGYEYFGSFYVPVAVHVLANLMAYVMTYTGIVNTFFVSWPVCIIALAAAAVCVYMLSRQKKLSQIAP